MNATTSFPQPWCAVSDRLPESGMIVLAAYRDEAGDWQVIRAFWAASSSVEANFASIHDEYDEEKDSYFLVEGWFEITNNTDDTRELPVLDGVVSHWAMLPSPPVVNQALTGAAP